MYSCLASFYDSVVAIYAVLQCFLGVYTLGVEFAGVLYSILAVTTVGLIAFAINFEYVQSKLSELAHHV